MCVAGYSSEPAKHPVPAWFKFFLFACTAEIDTSSRLQLNIYSLTKGVKPGSSISEQDGDK